MIFEECLACGYCGVSDGETRCPVCGSEGLECFSVDERDIEDLEE